MEYILAPWEKLDKPKGDRRKGAGEGKEKRMPKNESSKRPALFDWAITKHCTLNCLHCRGMTKTELSRQETLQAAQELIGLKPQWVILEGGEPLSREGIWEVLEILRAGNLEVSLITNGILLTPAIIHKLVELGIGIQISIDSPYPEVYENLRRGANFDRVMKAARDLAEAESLHAVNFVLSRENYQSLDDMFKLAKNTGVCLINIIGLKPTKDCRSRLLSPEQYREAVLAASRASREYGVDFFFDEPFFHASCKEWGIGNGGSNGNKKSRIVDPERAGCIFGEYLFMEPNGDLKPCTFADYVLGNAGEGLEAVWQRTLDSKFIAFVRDKRNRKSACGACDHRDACGGCRSRAYGLMEDWLESDIVCPIKPAEGELRRVLL